MARSISYYAEEEVRNAKGPEQQTLLVELSKFSSQRDAFRNKNPNRVLRATAPRLAQRALKKRYDDLFDELISYFTKDKFDDVITDETLKDIIIEDLGEKRQLPRNKTTGFAEGLVNSEHGRRWLTEHEIIRVKKKNYREAEKFVKEERRPIYRQKVGDGAEVWQIVNEKHKIVQVIYKDMVFLKKKQAQQVRYRDFNTGRYGPNPNRMRERIMIEKT
jgi:hypothetical protein